MIADQLNPLLGLFIQIPANQIKYARAVRSTIHKITDLDHRQVSGQPGVFATRPERG